MIDKVNLNRSDTRRDPPVLIATRNRTSVHELLQHGRYEQLLALLVQTKAPESDPLTDTLMMAQQIVQLCRKSQDEAAWYQGLAEKARRVEQEFSRQLEHLLKRLSEQKLSPAFARSGEGQPAPGDPVGEGVTTATPPALNVHCLGPFQATLNGQPLTDWPSLKARSIFKYLITHHPNPVGKETLMDVFWPEAEPEAARRNLHQAIYCLRGTLKAQSDDFPYILFEHDRYALNPVLSIWLDSVEFEQQIQAGRWLEHAGQPLEAMQAYCAAEALYRGDWLEEDLYEDWTRPQREHLWNSYLDITDSLGESFFLQGYFAEAIRFSHKILQRDNCHEGAHRRLMKCYQRQGQRHLAVRQYHHCVQALAGELGVVPSPETEALFRQLVGANGTLVPA
ncbi:MAG TPA: BTAD domain-containing putative transcriptional regulator [Anaerolineae bacterium]|nr:BTAD domain-containing putative transcriptional regulator [Anaerolineae bacterium]HMR65514.1 BTAD domain-containing putative transcriptional regulator [Anaerolineae bacterium]